MMLFNDPILHALHYIRFYRIDMIYGYVKIAENLIVHRYLTLIKGNDDYIIQVDVFVIIGFVF